MDEVPRERAISSEPCSGRPNPFDDTTDQTSRKRQRTSRGGSRSRSVDTAPLGEAVVGDSQMPSTSTLRGESTSTEAEADPPAPSTPLRASSEQAPAEPTSSRVTINLRTSRPLDTIPSSPPSPTTPSKMSVSLGDNGTRASIESESDALSTVAMETPTSSPSAMGSPEVELVTGDDTSEYGGRDPQVAIIDDDPMFLDPMTNFPYYAEGEPLKDTVGRMQRYLQYDAVESDDCFVKVRDWIESYLSSYRDLDLFHENFLKHQEFFGSIPEIFWGLNWRSRFFGDFLRRSTEGRRALSDMLSQIARLAGKFVTMDVKTLSYCAQKDDELEPQLGTRAYLHAIGYLLREDEVNHLGRNLENHYDWNWENDIVRLSDSLQREGGTIQAFTKLVRGQLRLLSKFPKLIDNLTDPSRLVSRLAGDAYQCLQEGNLSHHHQTVEGAKQKILQAYEFFKIMSVGLEMIIEKHVTFLTPEAALGHLDCLFNILRINLLVNSNASRDVVEQQQRDYSTLSAAQMPDAFALEWKLTMLKKLITSAQMQLRVAGVSTMCTDLLALFTKHRTISDVARNAILLYPAQYIIHNQLVDYLVGIGSHPEIINESNNILGFLIATRTYKPKQTDMIWQTVMKSQDPRVVEAILRMVTRCLNLYDYRSLLYLCTKLSDVPLTSFSMAMREYASNLFGYLVSKANQEGITYVDAPPYELCVRLMREASMPTPESPAGHVELQNFATLKLRDLLGPGPSPDVRNSIYLGCIHDIAAKSASTGGSICVINSLVRSPGVPLSVSTDLHTLTSEHGLTQLLVEEFESVSASGNQPTSSNPVSLARRELLLAIILEKPDSLSPELGERLWNVLVGSKSKSAAERSTSWNILNTAVQRSVTANNSFLTSCFREHFPRLPSHCFTRGALEFADYAVRSWLAEAPRDFSEEECKFESPALEQIWHMILTAPPNTIDAEAIKILVGVFVDSAPILSFPRPVARNVHLALVNRCLSQLKGAASQLKAFSDGASSGSDEGMVIVASEDQFQEQEKTFARSLAVLREFLRAYQIKPQFATPKSRSPITAATTNPEGEPLMLKYQSFDGGKQTEIKSLSLGKLNTAASLFATLQKATGFKNYKVYCGGREINPDEIEVCKSLEELNINGLVLVRSREATDEYLTGKGSLEVEITKHFDDLWSYLGMHEKVAQEIYYFLIKFPIYARMVEDFKSDVSYATIFPSGQPFKSLYAIHCLRDHISTQSKQAALGEDLLLRAIKLVVSAISDPNVLDQCGGDHLKDCLALHLLDCFIQLLKESPLPQSLPGLLDERLLDRLLQLLYGAMASETSQNSVHLTWRSFEAILDAASHCSELWQSFGTHLNNKSLMQDLLLDEARPAIRKSVVKHVTQKCISISSSTQIATINFAMTFWPIVAALIPAATRRPEQCEETFNLALILFNKLANASTPSDLFNLNELVKEWGTLLIAHTSQEIVGYPESIDMITHGLANLLLSAAQRAKSSRQTLTCGSIGTKLFRTHLFPQISWEKEISGELTVPRIPLLNPTTRQIMAEAIYFLVKDDERQYSEVVSSMAELVPHATREDTPYIYEMSFQFERAKSIRSHTGYVGLRNLSNTCYLNSLFTQLFMNIPFREFMLQAPISHNLGSEGLLSETQRLFGHMQNSFRRFVDPAKLASSIRTYEETPIDVTVQMDVDEFYNLLFDRWEGQIGSAEAKRKFKSFYGGQLVQQVKSKECPHISERFEPFSAIQCDIKGKTCLQESLQAYVDGEVMEGDNKYKCSQCDRHVDAVKRTCLKDIPDNLICHLKRFDFNLRTLQRSKINDHFSFPRTIDMRPYTVEYLTDSPEDIPEDMFELVGVLVHAGTAESGHYYSFIRERPSTSEKEAWFEFNDDTVTPWDPNLMENACFGGPEYRGPLDTGLQYDKTWSAYMLFYQRSSSLASQRQSLQRSSMAVPVRLPVPTELANHITMENEVLMRKYCLFDPSHATFVIKMLSNVKQLNGGRCSTLHRTEKSSLDAAANHLDQVFARTKDIPDFASFMMTIRQICHNCPECSRDYLEWFFDCPEALKQLLLKNPDAVVRNDVASSILLALSKVKIDASYAYGLGDDEDSADDAEDHDPQLLQRMVRALSKLFEVFQTNLRAWPEYFGLVWSIAKMGKHEAALLLDAGFLRKSLEIVSADPLLPLNGQYQKMLSVISKRMATRPASYDSVIGLLSTLMESCDASLDTVPDDQERLEIAIHKMPVPFTITERHLIMQHWTRNQAHILIEKLLMIDQNPTATDAILVELLGWHESLDQNILAAILHGIKQRMHTRSFLRAAILYCQHSENHNAFTTIVTHAAKVACHVEGDGKEFLRFFKAIFDLDDGDLMLPKEEVLETSLDQMCIWAPPLLTDSEASVRDATAHFLDDLIFSQSPEIDYGQPKEQQAHAEMVVLTAKKLGLACLDYLQERFMRQRQVPVRSTIGTISGVIEKIKEFFDPEDSDDVYSQRFFEQLSTVLPALRKCAVDEPEDDISDWDGSDDAYDDSSEPPMDRLGDIGGVEDVHL